MILDRRQALALGSGMAALTLIPLCAQAGAAPVIRLTSVRHGAVGWLIETIRAEGLDKKYAFELSVVEVATNQASPIALLAGEADVTVSDWTWALRQRARGQDFKFSSFSSALGSLVVPKGSSIKTLADLEGKKLGVAGSATDKSWILMRAYSRKVLGRDLSTICDTVFGAAALITEEFKTGRLDACLNYWTYSARLVSLGGIEVLTMADIVKELGVSPTPPLVGFIWSEKTVKEKAIPVDALLAAAAEANAILAKSDDAWTRLKPLVKPASDAEFSSIKAAFRAGITLPWSPAETASAEKLTNLLIELGDAELVGDGTRFDPKLFYTKAG